MTDLFLIAHKVRGEPAFDIAQKIACAECNGNFHGAAYHGLADCVECDGEGFWWIIPTSGHRAYPWYHIALSAMTVDYQENTPLMECPPMPPSLPDHYTTRATPARPSLASLLAIPRPKLTVDRRF